MAPMQKKDFARPDETRKFDKGLLELVTLGGVTFGRAILQPGWRWSTSVKPLVKTKSCEAPEFKEAVGYQRDLYTAGVFHPRVSRGRPLSI